MKTGSTKAGQIPPIIVELARRVGPTGHPGALPHLADDHGIDPARVTAAFEAADFDTAST